MVASLPQTFLEKDIMNFILHRIQAREEQLFMQKQIMMYLREMTLKFKMTALKAHGLKLKIKITKIYYVDVYTGTLLTIFPNL